MRQLIFIFITFFVTSEISLAEELKEGIYRLTGMNASTRKSTYTGTVAIQRSDEGYRMFWRIENTQAQEGIAYFSNNVLSGSYRDLGVNSGGVIHFEMIRPGVLEGPWRSFEADRTSGRELLEYQEQLPRQNTNVERKSQAPAI